MQRREFNAVLFAQTLRARETSYAHEHPDMLIEWLAGQLNDYAQGWDRERDQIQAVPQVEARNRTVRAKMIEMIHGLPERTPLDPVVTATFDRTGYRVENVIFHSRPGFPVTANLYVPAGRGPFPAILSPCGHYADGRMYPEYQSAYINLVKAGFVVLAFDPVGQGERRQYWNPTTGATEVGGATTEHSMAGQLLLLMGEDLTQYRVWDGMRGIDYLLSRPEVDRGRIGCAGHSGGGTLTMFISALDERVQAAVVNQGGTSHRWPLKLSRGSRIGPSDVEQNLFPAAVHGVDLCDIHVAIAPRPLLCLIEDYNPAFERAATHIRRRYEQLGAPEKFATEEATDPHAWTPKLRLATTNWFCRWFLNRPGPEREPEFEIEAAASLYCTPKGSVRYSGKGDTVNARIARKGASLRPADRLDVARLIRYQPPGGPLGVRHLVTTPRKGYAIDKVEFLSEPGIYLPAWIFVPERPLNGLPLVYVHESGKQADGLEFGSIEKRVRNGETVIAVDVRGIGETRPPHPPAGDRPGEFGFLFDVETAMAYMAWYLDRSLFGMRVQDVVRAIDYTVSRTKAGGARLYGRGAGALWCLFAAALDPRVHVLTCDRALISYRALTQTDRYLHGASVFVRDILLEGDLPQVAALMAGRELVMASPVDAMKRVVSLEEASRVYQPAAEAFQRRGGSFRVTASPSV